MWETKWRHNILVLIGTPPPLFSLSIALTIQQHIQYVILSKPNFYINLSDLFIVII